MGLLSQILNMTFFISLFFGGILTVKKGVGALHQVEIFLEHSTQLVLTKEKNRTKNKWVNQIHYQTSKSNNHFSTNNIKFREIRMKLNE